MSTRDNLKTLELMESTKDSGALERIINSLDKNELYRFEECLTQTDKSFKVIIERLMKHPSESVIIKYKNVISKDLTCVSCLYNHDYTDDADFLGLNNVKPEIGFTIKYQESVINCKGSGTLYNNCTASDWKDFLVIAFALIKQHKKDFSIFGTRKETKEKDNTESDPDQDTTTMQDLFKAAKMNKTSSRKQPLQIINLDEENWD